MHSKHEKIIIFIILAILTFGVVSFFDKVLAIGSLFLVFLCLVVLYFLPKFKMDGKLLVWLFLITFLLHILGVLFIYYTNFQPFSGGYGDFVVYQQQAQEIAVRVQQENFSLQGLQGIDVGHYYPVIIGYLYAFTVPSMLIGQLFSAWLVALIVVFVYLIVCAIGGTEKEGFLTGLIASVYPSLAFYGSLLLKDALVVLLCLIGLLLTLKIIKKFTWSTFLIFYVVLTALIHFRFYIGYALMFGFIISWFLVSTFNLKKRIIYGIIISLLLGFSPQFLGTGYYGFRNFESLLNTETITFYREIVYAPSVQPPPVQLQPTVVQPTTSQLTVPQPGRGSSIVIKTGFGSSITFIKNTLLSFICSLLGPFPWQMTQNKHLFVLPEVIAWYFLFFFIVKGIIKSIRRHYRAILPLIIFASLVLGVLSLFMTNFGIITRIRIPAFLALLCLFPFGFKQLKDIKIPLLSKIFNI